eukprot:CCRYP_018703-RB/>CCRYP_018703-RB protein AED:0.02 eAED:0.02 QI:810/1/1/1/1/1/2/523/219
MKRTEPNQGKLLPHVEAEPDFYQMDFIHPLPPSPFYPPPPIDFHAGVSAGCAYPYPHGGHAPYWPPDNVQPDASHYPYGHYHGQAPAPPRNYPPPPSYDPYGYPYPQPPPHHSLQQHPMYPHQGQEHMMVPPYHGGYPCAALLPQPYPPYGQPQGYADPHAYNVYPPHPNEVEPRLSVNQPHPPNSNDVYANQQQALQDANHSDNDNEEGREGLNQQNH